MLLFLDPLDNPKSTSGAAKLLLYTVHNPRTKGCRSLSLIQQADPDCPQEARAQAKPVPSRAWQMDVEAPYNSENLNPLPDQTEGGALGHADKAGPFFKGASWW